MFSLFFLQNSVLLQAKENPTASDQITSNPTIEDTKSKPDLNIETSSDSDSFLNRLNKSLNPFNKEKIDYTKFKVPTEFINTNFQVKKVIESKKLIYLKLSNHNLNTNNVFIAYIRTQNDICLLPISAIEEELILVNTSLCPYRDEILVGDHLLLKNPDKLSIWEKPKTSFAGMIFSYGQSQFSIDNQKFDGGSLRLGGFSNFDFHKNGRVFLSYSVGKDDLSKSKPSLTTAFHGVSNTQILINAKQPENYIWTLGSHQLIPLIGSSLHLNEVKGDDSLNMTSLGLNLGLQVLSPSWGSQFELDLNFCIVYCNITETNLSATASYEKPTMLRLLLNGYTELNFLPNWDLVTGIEFSKVNASQAKINGNANNSRSLSKQYLGFNIGLAKRF